DITNLQRQIVHATDRIGALKVESARDTLAAVNPGVRVETHPLRLGPENAEEVIREYDLVADGSDNFATRYLLTDLCYRLERPLRAGGLSPLRGQPSPLKTHLGPGPPFSPLPVPDPPPPALVPARAAPRALCRRAPLPGA